MLTRRQVLKRGIVGGAVLMAPSGLLTSRAVAQSRQLRKFRTPCPTPGGSWPVIDLRTTPATTLNLKQFGVTVHPDLRPTTVWGYEPAGGPPAGRSTYLGPTLVAERGTPVNVTFNNQLPALPLFPADPALLPPGAVNSRINTHLHGGRIADTEDGNPFDAYGDLATGQPEVAPGGSQTRTYANGQGGALLWYHDHALGITRTNVYAGLAGGYLLTEPAGSPHAVGNVPTAFDASDVPDPYAPAGKIPLHIPLVIQDRDFNGRGQLRYPYPWAPEFFGANCLVNGRAFPYLKVQRRKYRFTFLNGSQSRFYNLGFTPAPASITQSGVELGPLDAPQAVTSILISPAERADVVVDFSNLPIGTTVRLTDAALPAGVVSPTKPLGDCMEFRVVGPALAGPDPFAGPPVLPGWSAASPTPRPGSASTTSKVTLEEVLGRGGKPVMAVVNGTPFMTRDAADMMTATPSAPFSTEIVPNGSTVDWVYLNLTADSHPFHTHLGHFEVMDRQPFDAVAYETALAAAREAAASPPLDPADYPNPTTLGPAVAAPLQEKGPKDTVIANPGQITRIRIKFDLPAGMTGPAHYVYHCHILEHEENEMMRPLLIT